MLPTLLPLTVFEEYMLLDSTPVYPMECHCRLRFSGGFDHTTAEEALAEALRAHPFLYAHCKETRPSRYAWEIPSLETFANDPIQHKEGFSSILGVRVCWLDGICRQEYPVQARESLNIFSETMIRLYFVEEKDASGRVLKTDLVLKCHHSASDGKGIFRFLMDFLIACAQKEGIEMAEWEKIPQLDPETLPKRHRYGRTLRERLWQLLICTAHLPRSLRLVFHPIQSIVQDRDLGEQDQPMQDFPAILFRKLGAEDAAVLLKRCHEKNCTFNDIMLQAVWTGTKAWRHAHPDTAYRGKHPWIRIAVPFDLRHKSQVNVPASNIVSMLFCDRKEKEIDTSKRFLNGIEKEMRHAKKYSLGFLLIQSLKDARNFCGNLRGAVKICDCWASMVLTNLGPVFTPKMFPFPRTKDGKLQIGSLVLDEIDSASPIRQQTNLSLCCATYAGEMDFSMIYDSRVMDPQTANDYFDVVLGELRTLLD